MMQKCTCRQCGKTFEGGPRAYYCLHCRGERKKRSYSDYQRRKRQGGNRALGSKDSCERCGSSYTVIGGLQRFCTDCKLIHALEYDRKTSLEFYHKNKSKINPPRNERRRKNNHEC